MKKILFSDIDGTILEGHHAISSKDQEAIHRLRKKGHYFAFCTGRNLQEAKAIAHLFEYDYMVLNNGAMIVDRDDHVLLRKQIKNKDAQEILQYCLQRYPHLIYTFYDGYNTYEYISHHDTKVLKGDDFVKIDENFEDLLKQMKGDFDIFCAFHPDEKLEEILDIQKYIDDHYEGIHGTLNKIYLDVTVDHCSKGTGLQTLSSMIDEDVETYCIGDSYNDISMFETAMHPYTFHRVSDDIKKHTEKQVNYVYEVIEEMLEENE